MKPLNAYYEAISLCHTFFFSLYQENSSFGPACCLVKRWLSAHLLDSGHISEESIELLVASLYLRPQPHEPPQQPQVAFFRFHYMMATTNWNTECIILNMNEELSRKSDLFSKQKLKKF